ncbi:MAG: YdcF family protein [Anaerolineales bacterium]|nr:YdcF family protein [Anaerolineales bacterium]
MKRFFHTLKRILLYTLALGLSVLILPRIITTLHSLSRIYTIENVPAMRAAIVFGAGLWRDGSPTPVLRDRVATAAELYFAGKVEKLLMSGDNRFVDYNEPAAMRSYAISLGVPEQDIILDYAGRRTYDTCYRARAIFGLQQAILVTQSFHLPRALYLCSTLGLDIAGVPADRRDYHTSSLVWWNLRELPATLTALWEVHVTHPLPVLGEPEPIFPLEAQ